MAMVKSMVSGRAPLVWGLRRVSRLGWLGRLCADVPELLRQYDQWFGFCATYEAAAHWIVHNDGVPKLLPLAQWPQLKSQVLNPGHKRVLAGMNSPQEVDR